tara:strand:+ start:168 stop:365 length:198 start_codon:yes stop_codon:yes gene_type:complete
LQFDRYFTPCSHGPFVAGAFFRFAPFRVASSSVTLTSTPSSAGSLLTVGRKVNLNIPAPFARAAE